MKPVLSVSGLSKKYCRELRASLLYGVRDVVRDLMPFSGPAAGLRRGEFWALDDVSFDLGAGEAMAVVGRNGAGKSTLLRILSGLIKPDKGSVSITGRTSELIELGTGFNPLLSGRENALAVGALHGLGGGSRRRLLDQVIDFAGLEEFIDSPVQAYSAGMKARLAFAVAAHLEPDLLLADEVLAVGDHEFQRKCLEHMRRYVEQGGALLLVSHSSFQVQMACSRGILLDHGRLAFSGSAAETLDRHYDRELAERADPPAPAAADSKALVIIDKVHASNPSGGPLRTGEPMRISVDYRSTAARDALWGFSIWTGDQWVCVAGEVEQPARRLEAGSGALACTIPGLPLLSGRYWLRVAISDPVTWVPFALRGWEDSGLPIQVAPRGEAKGDVDRLLRQLVTIDVDWH